MSFTINGTSTKITSTNYNPLSDPSGTNPPGTWTYYLYSYSNSGTTDTITFTPSSFFSKNSSPTTYMCLISQGGLGATAGANASLGSYNNYSYNLTVGGGAGGGGAGGQVYTNSLSTNSKEVTVTLYPRGASTPSQYNYNSNTIKVSYGYNGEIGLDGEILYHNYSQINQCYENLTFTTGYGGNGGNTSNTGSGGDSNTSSTTYRYGGGGGNGGGNGTFSTPTPVNNTPSNSLYETATAGIGGTGITAYGGTNGSPGVQSGSTQGPVGATKVKFGDGLTATIAEGGLGGYGGTAPTNGSAGNQSAFMFFFKD